MAPTLTGNVRLFIEDDGNIIMMKKNNDNGKPTRVHFFEAMERELDIQKEYYKLEEICDERYFIDKYSRTTVSINDWIDNYFRNWKKRSNYASFEELREHLGFQTDVSRQRVISGGTVVGLDMYLLFCEMIINLIEDLSAYRISALKNATNALIDTIIATIDKLGLEIKNIDNGFVIVEKKCGCN